MKSLNRTFNTDTSEDKGPLKALSENQIMHLCSSIKLLQETSGLLEAMKA
jgi:hypothetical protein